MSDEAAQEGRPSNRQGSTGQQTFSRLRAGSLAEAASYLFLDVNPQRPMWGATGNAISHAPNLTDLRSPVVGGDNIIFDAHGHSAREAHFEELKQQYLNRTQTHKGLALTRTKTTKSQAALPIHTANEIHREDASYSGSENTEALTNSKAPWSKAALNGLIAFGKFVIAPTGFLMTVYGLNVVAWGAMLFFLLLHAAPAMDHPDNGDAIGSPRRIWNEVDSQVLNALFCLTAWGLAPWRFRDLWWCSQWRFSRNKEASRRAIHRLAAKNASWFWLRESDMDESELAQRLTFSGATAPATSTWKMDFVVWMFALNSLFQVGMAFFMWHWNYYERPSWGAGTFIGLGCAVSLAAGVMCWWEGRKIKKIEGPKVIESKDAKA